MHIQIHLYYFDACFDTFIASHDLCAVLEKNLYSILLNFVNCYSFDYSPLAKVETAWTNAHSGSFKLFSCVF